jgi:hypothetical protein
VGLGGCLLDVGHLLGASHEHVLEKSLRAPRGSFRYPAIQNCVRIV